MMRNSLLLIIPLLLTGCTQQNTQELSPLAQDCLNKEGQYFAEDERCVFPDGQVCFASDYRSDDGCYPEQIGKRETTPCVGYEGLDVCTLHYDPVCAKVQSGGNVVWQTFSNECMACVSSSNANRVLGFVEGECDDYAVTK
jgi:hypothetical protein